LGVLDALLRGDLARKRAGPVIRLPAPEELEGFSAWLTLQGKTERTVRERLQYLERLAEELGLSPSIEAVLAFLAEEESPHARDHYKKALRLWLRYSWQKEALEYLRGGWAPSREPEPAVTLEEALEIAGLAWGVDRRYAVYLLGLLVTGLRPSELRSARRDRAKAPLVFEIEKPSTRTKRSTGYAFVTPAWLELRDAVLGKGYERLVWWRRETEHQALKTVREKYPGFAPYQLRSLNLWLLTRAGLDLALANYLQGRAPKTIGEKHYLRRLLQRENPLLWLLEQHNKALREVDQYIREELLPRISQA
jgi:integrase